MGRKEEQIWSLTEHELGELFALDGCVLDISVGRWVKGVEVALFNDALESNVDLRGRVWVLDAETGTNVLNYVCVNQANLYIIQGEEAGI